MLFDAVGQEESLLLGRLIDAARTSGAGLYLVGGPVRDLLLGRPLRDLDLIVQGVADEGLGAAAALAARLEDSGARVVEHGRFGTVNVTSGDASIDLASVRSETYERPGALPTVSPGSLEDDLVRRDFTVNAMALRLSGESSAQRLELVSAPGAEADLQSQKLLILLPRCFLYAPSRALRAARLAPRLGFTLSRDSRSALRSALRDGAFGGVSGERLRREIQKLFEDAALGTNPARALRALSDWHVLGALEPGLELPRDAVAPLRRLGKYLAEPPWQGPAVRGWVAGLALWLGAVPPAMRRRVLQRFSIRGARAEQIQTFPKLAGSKLVALAKARGRGAVDALLGDTDEEIVHALHALAEPLPRRRILRWAAEDRGRRIPVSGRDLIELGLSGPEVGRVIARIREAFLDGEVLNREEAITLAQEAARRQALAERRRERRKKDASADSGA